MTTIAYKQYTNIPYMSGSYASAPVNGPISTNRTPCQMPTHNLGVLTGRHPNPPQFYPSDGASQTSNARSQYLRTSSYKDATLTGYNNSQGKTTSFFSAGTQRQYATTQNTKYIAPSCSSLYISTKRSRAVGKSSFKQGLPNAEPLTYKNFNRNDVRHALKSVRGGGCVAPAKQGSIFNYSLCNGKVCAYGSIATSNY
jgi:hypothetical protein